jgi:DUF4097 and DUF4098 domain-containing protein YvlB
MRRHSVTGPLILVAIGAVCLWYNLHPEVRLWDLMAAYWPFLLIAWGLLRLIEVGVNAAANRPLPRGLSGGEIVLIVFVCLIGSGAYSAHRHNWNFGPARLDVFGEQYDYPVNVQAVAGKGQRIVFQNLRGNLRITGGDLPEIRISGRKNIRAFRKQDADQADRETGIEVVSEGDHIVVRGNVDRVGGDRRVSADLEVTVPRSAAIEAHTRAGDVDVTDVAGDVDVSSDRADVRLNKLGGSARVDLHRSDLIRVADVKGNLDLQGRGSDVQLENVAGQVTVNGSYSGTLSFKNLAKPLHFQSPNTELRVEALPGEINMDLGDLTAKNLVGPIQLKTKSKDVKIEDFTQSLELETERGDIEIAPGRVPLAKIDARSRSGKIELALPDKSAFQLTASADHGDAVNDFGPAIHREGNDRSATLRGSVGNGPTISLTTERGSVLVRKATAEAAKADMAPEKF